MMEALFHCFCVFILYVALFLYMCQYIGRQFNKIIKYCILQLDYCL